MGVFLENAKSDGFKVLGSSSRLRRRFEEHSRDGKGWRCLNPMFITEDQIAPKSRFYTVRSGLYATRSVAESRQSRFAARACVISDPWGDLSDCSRGTRVRLNVIPTLDD